MANLTDFEVSKNIKLLAYGNSGTGKTCAATGFPGPVWVADFDNKISSAAAYHKGTSQLAQISYENYGPVDTRGTSIEKFNIKLAEMNKSKLFPRTLVVDSLTTFSDEAIRFLMRMNPGLKRMDTKGASIPSLQDYQVARLFFKEIITGVINFPCNVIFLAHIQIDKDESTGEIFRTPMMAGKLSRELPIYFEEVYRIYCKDGKYLAQTKSDNRYNCRTQIKGLPAEIEFKYDELIKQR